MVTMGSAKLRAADSKSDADRPAEARAPAAWRSGASRTTGPADRRGRLHARLRQCNETDAGPPIVIVIAAAIACFAVKTRGGVGAQTGTPAQEQPASVA